MDCREMLEEWDRRDSFVMSGIVLREDVQTITQEIVAQIREEPPVCHPGEAKYKAANGVSFTRKRSAVLLHGIPKMTWQRSSIAIVLAEVVSSQ